MIFITNLKTLNPKPFQEIGNPAVISGYISKSWMKSGTDIYIEAVSTDAMHLIVGSFTVDKTKSIYNFFNLKKYFFFSTELDYSPFISSLKSINGFVNLRLVSPCGKSVFIPVIMKNCQYDNISPEIRNKMKNVKNLFGQFKREVKQYRKKKEQILKRVENKIYIGEEKKFNHLFSDYKIIDDVFEIFNLEDEYNADYTFEKEDRMEDRLTKKYSKAIEWDLRNGDKGAGVGSMDGFYFIIHSNDHDKHFHIIHRGRGVDARFSFPSVELINYKRKRNYISSKEIKKLQEYIHRPEVFTVFEKEFSRRDNLNSLSLPPISPPSQKL